MLGRILLTIDAVGLLLGAAIADMSETHMYNPNWRPHAKFHNAQTIQLSFLLGCLTLWYTWHGPAKPLTPQLRREFTLIRAFAGSVYWLTGLTAILFPGTMGLDPEFGGPGFPQMGIFVGFMASGLLGTWLES